VDRQRSVFFGMRINIERRLVAKQTDPEGVERASLEVPLELEASSYGPVQVQVRNYNDRFFEVLFLGQELNLTEKAVLAQMVGGAEA
jgi:hypothetical protein